VVYPETEDEARLNSSAVFSDAVRPAADEALGLAQALGGFGPAHVVLKFESRGFPIVPPQQSGILPFPGTTAQAWSVESRLPEATLNRWEREFLRDAGFTVHEPDDAVGA
jgi:hypothetical protein